MTREEGIKLMMSGKKLKVGKFMYFYDKNALSAPFRARFIEAEKSAKYSSWDNGLYEIEYRNAEIINEEN